MKFLLFPLGNPGVKYEKTRHNAARVAILHAKKDKEIEKFLKENEIEIFTPDCYMNESGNALKTYLKNKNFDKKNVIVVYDDKDIEIGNVKLSHSRGDGGHNGLKNIIENLGIKDFFRIRIGIAPKGTGKDGLVPPHGEVVQKYVLGNMTKGEEEILKSKKVLERIKIFLQQIIDERK